MEGHGVSLLLLLLAIPGAVGCVDVEGAAGAHALGAIVVVVHNEVIFGRRKRVLLYRIVGT